MSLRRILHPQNRIVCEQNSPFYKDVQQLAVAIREKVMKSDIGGVYFIDLKNTSDDAMTNYETLQLILNVLRQHISLQIKKTLSDEAHKKLIHMALSRIDQENDAEREDQERGEANVTKVHWPNPLVQPSDQ